MSEQTRTNWPVIVVVLAVAVVWVVLIPARIAYAEDPPPAPALCDGATDSAGLLGGWLGVRGPVFLTWSETDDAKDGTDSGEQWQAFLSAASAVWNIQSCLAVKAASETAHTDAVALRQKLDRAHDDAAAAHDDAAAILVKLDGLTTAVENQPAPAAGDSGEVVAQLGVMRSDGWYAFGALAGVLLGGVFWRLMRP